MTNQPKKYKYIELEFILRPERGMGFIDSQQLEMVKWCKLRNMEMSVTEMPHNHTKVARVKFYRDKNTHAFITEFLEFPVGHALPFDSLTTIPDVKVINK